MSQVSEIQNNEGATSEIGYDEWPSITGSISYEEAEITGYLIVDSEIITGEISMPAQEEIEIYQGTTVVIPSTVGDIVLETSQKQVLDDITVKKIFYAAVTNPSGGYTVTIGDENG